MADTFLNVKAQFIQVEGDPLWYVNIITEGGCDMISDAGFKTPQEAQAALDDWMAQAGGNVRTLH